MLTDNLIELKAYSDVHDLVTNFVNEILQKLVVHSWLYTNICKQKLCADNLLKPIKH